MSTGVKLLVMVGEKKGVEVGIGVGVGVDEAAGEGEIVGVFEGFWSGMVAFTLKGRVQAKGKSKRAKRKNRPRPKRDNLAIHFMENSPD